MRFTAKYLPLLCICLILGGCGATGELLGNITMLPVRAVGTVARAATYKDDPASRAGDIAIYNIEEAISLHQIN
ncbi:MAG: hypothetical protein KAJ29_06770 [Alphaproteobacteria bacterium]|nr:hypothetical protein [Alphaproteobacteria bacterium]